MSQAIIYGFAPNELRPGPDFSAGSDSTGKWTGSQTFTCRKFDYSSTIIQLRLAKGNRATAVYPELGAEWDFLYIDSHTHEHQPGGFTKIVVQYTGSSNDGGGSSTESTYSLTGSVTERPMIEHPKFITECSQTTRWGIVALLDGSGRRNGWAETGDLIIVDTIGDTIATIDPTGVQGTWYDLIITKGKTTYDASSLEWTVSKSNSGGISAEDLSKLGYIDTPDGSPPSFTDRDWRLVSASENKTRSGSSSVKSWSKTWQLSPPGEKWNASIYSPA